MNERCKPEKDFYAREAEREEEAPRKPRAKAKPKKKKR
jgi:hypothetical protein